MLSFAFQLLLSLVLAPLVSPYFFPSTDPKATKMTSVTPILSDVMHLAQYAFDTCILLLMVDNGDVALGSWACTITPCNAVVPGFQLTNILPPNNADMVGFIGIHPTDAEIIVSYRGTKTLQTLIDDLQVIFTSPNGIFPNAPSNARVHSGFLNSYRASITSPTGGITTIDTLVMQTVYALAIQHPTYKIRFTGHSLGAAVATLASIDFFLLHPEMAPRMSLYNFGKPRIGNAAYASWVCGSILPYFPMNRITNEYDVVPRLPTYGTGYVHEQHEYFITNSYELLNCPSQTGDHCGESVGCEFNANPLNLWDITYHSKLGYFQPLHL